MIYVFQTNDTSPPADGQEPESTVEGLQEEIRKVEVSPHFFIFLAVYCNIRISVSDISFTVPQTGILYTKLLLFNGSCLNV